MSFDALEGVEMPASEFDAGLFNDVLQLNYSDYYAMNMPHTADTSLLIAFTLNELRETFRNDDYKVTAFSAVVNGEQLLIVAVKNIPICKLGDALFTFDNVEVTAVDYLARIAANDEKSEEMHLLCRALYSCYQEAMEIAALVS